jgi:hypothetical protein
MAWVISHAALIAAIVYALVSEAIAIRQQLKYPDNDGVGGVLAAVMKALQAVGAKDPRDLPPPAA